MKRKIKKWFKKWDGDTCPKCKMLSIIYANFKPSVSCGECGFEVNPNTIKELILENESSEL